jgi:hypothetical protein
MHDFDRAAGRFILPDIRPLADYEAATRRSGQAILAARPTKRSMKQGSG